MLGNVAPGRRLRPYGAKTLAPWSSLRDDGHDPSLARCCSLPLLLRLELAGHQLLDGDAGVLVVEERIVDRVHDGHFHADFGR
jgi:hypothetical protein